MLSRTTPMYDFFPVLGSMVKNASDLVSMRRITDSRLRHHCVSLFPMCVICSCVLTRFGFVTHVTWNSCIASYFSFGATASYSSFLIFLIKASSFAAFQNTTRRTAATISQTRLTSSAKAKSACQKAAGIPNRSLKVVVNRAVPIVNAKPMGAIHSLRVLAACK